MEGSAGATGVATGGAIDAVTGVAEESGAPGGAVTGVVNGAAMAAGEAARVVMANVTACGHPYVLPQPVGVYAS